MPVGDFNYCHRHGRTFDVNGLVCPECAQEVAQGYYSGDSMSKRETVFCKDGCGPYHVDERGDNCPRCGGCPVLFDTGPATPETDKVSRRVIEGAKDFVARHGVDPEPSPEPEEGDHTQDALELWQSVKPEDKEAAYAALLDMRDNLRKSSSALRIQGLTHAQARLSRRADMMNVALDVLGYSPPGGPVRASTHTVISE